MKKNYLKSCPAKKTTKKTTKRTAKKVAKKTLSHDAMVGKVMAKVKHMCDYASRNLCVEDADLEELEWMLYQYIK